MLLLKSVFLVLVLASCGFLTVSVLLKDYPIYQRLSLSLPYGVMSWGVLWVLMALLFSVTDINNGAPQTLNLFYFLLAFMVALFFYALHAKLALVSRHLAITFIVIIAMLTSIYFYVGFVYMTGDSFYLINWIYDVNLSLQEGYPIILRGVLSLSRLIDPDFYLYVIHPILIIFLCYLLLGLLLDQGQAANRSRWGTLIVAIFVISIFALNRAFGINAYYVNHHVLASIGFLSISGLMIRETEFSNGHLFFIAFTSLSITMLRMEGFIFVILWMICFTMMLSDRTQRSLLFGLVLIFNTPYIGYLSIKFWDDGFINGQKFFLLWVLYILTSLMLCHPTTEKLFAKRNIGPTVMLGLALVFAILVMLKPAHMLGNLSSFHVAYFDPWFWGVESHFVVLASLVIWFVRLKRKEYYVGHDALFYFFISATLLNICLTFFRIPLKVVWIDSANRIMFHFIPLLMLWIGLEINRRNFMLLKNLKLYKKERETI